MDYCTIGQKIDRFFNSFFRRERHLSDILKSHRRVLNIYRDNVKEVIEYIEVNGLRNDPKFGKIWGICFHAEYSFKNSIEGEEIYYNII
jgi:hypothetical protein